MGKVMNEFNLGDRVRFTDKPFLSGGSIYNKLSSFGEYIYVVKLDEKAPNEYAFETDEVVSLSGSDLELEQIAVK